MISYSEACKDPNLFGPWFAAPSWDTWAVIDKALFGEPLTESELATFRELTGRTEAPTEPASECWIVAGRRGGKDVKAASIAVYLATIVAESGRWKPYLTRGERPVVQLIAVDRDQAKVCLGYARAFFEQPLLARLVARETAEGVELTNDVAIEITTNDKRRVRGRTVLAAIFDEVAFYSGDGASSDEELYEAIKPAMATIEGAMLIGISSPYARRGLLFRKHAEHYGRPGSTLVIQAPTWVLNPTLPRDGEFLSAAFEADATSASAEYGAEFRSDVLSFVNPEALAAVIPAQLRERTPSPDIAYMAFVDPSGGSADSFTLAIGHTEGGRQILDCIREVRPPFSPESVVDEFCALLKSYGCAKVTGDRYAGEWPREQFRKRRIEYALAEKPRSDLYLSLLPLINSGTCELLANDKLVTQLTTLERRTSRAGKDAIDHPPGGHDDLANAVAGVMALLAEPEAKPFRWYAGDGKFSDGRTLKEEQPKYPKPMTREFLESIQGELTSWH
jgi:hypothetical protein